MKREQPKQKKRIGLYLINCLAVILLLAIYGNSYGASVSETPKIIKVGVALSLSGPLQREGTLMRDGYKLWEKHVNQKGGIDVGKKKYKVKLIIYDDKGEAVTATTLVERLITSDKVDFIFGPYGSGLTAAASAITEKYKKIMLASFANSPKVFDRGFKYLFGLLPDISMGIGLHVDLVKTIKPLPETMAIIYPDELFAASSADAIKRKAEQNGLKIVYYEKYLKNTKDLSGVLTEIKRLAPDILITTGYFEDTLLAVKQARDLDLNVNYWGTLDTPFHNDFVATLGKSAEFIYGMAWWVPESGWKGPVFGTSREYNKLFNKEYGRDATYYSAGPSAMGVILQTAIEKAGTIETEAVRKTLAMLDIETFYNPVKYDERGFNINGSGVIVQIQNGTAQTVWPLKLRQSAVIYPAITWKKR